MSVLPISPSDSNAAFTRVISNVSSTLLPAVDPPLLGLEPEAAPDEEMPDSVPWDWSAFPAAAAPAPDAAVAPDAVVDAGLFPVLALAPFAAGVGTSPGLVAVLTLPPVLVAVEPVRPSPVVETAPLVLLPVAAPPPARLPAVGLSIVPDGEAAAPTAALDPPLVPVAVSVPSVLPGPAVVSLGLEVPVTVSGTPAAPVVPVARWSLDPGAPPLVLPVSLVSLAPEVAPESPPVSLLVPLVAEAPVVPLEASSEERFGSSEVVPVTLPVPAPVDASEPVFPLDVPPDVALLESGVPSEAGAPLLAPPPPSPAAGSGDPVPVPEVAAVLPAVLLWPDVVPSTATVVVSVVAVGPVACSVVSAARAVSGSTLVPTPGAPDPALGTSGLVTASSAPAEDVVEAVPGVPVVSDA